MNRAARLTLRSSDAASRWNFNGTTSHATAEFGAGGGASGEVRHTDGTLVRRFAHPLDVLRYVGRFDAEQASTPSSARWVGFLSYDLARHLESLPSGAADDLGLPLMRFALATPGDAPSIDLAAPAFTSAVSSASMTRAGYLSAARRALDYIAAGDCFQVNLARRFTVAPAPPPAAAWGRLCAAGTPAYGALLDFGDLAIVSASPELFFRVDVLPDGRRRIVNRPMKGTRPRLPNMAADLWDSPKDRAELAMIVDLQRNDLGRVCQIGTVRVTDPRVIEAHPTVYQGVATIEGVLRPDVGLAEIIAAVFPCGSVTGCPKVRAMQVIDELEPVRRGPYCGAIGYVAADGTMAFSVAIRTAVWHGGFAHLSVGAGIVADSDPQAEYEETLVKSRAMLAALGV